MRKFIYTLAAVILISFNISAQTGWIGQLSPTGPINLGKIQYVNATEGWISATNGKLLHTVNSGTNWSIITLDPLLLMFALSDPDLSMCFINPSTGWVVRSLGVSGNPNGAVLFRTYNGGMNWTKLIIPNFDFAVSVQFVDANNGWMLLGNSTLTVFGIFRTTDGGNTWGTIMTPPVIGLPFFINSNTGWLMPISPGGSGMTSDSIRKTTNGGVTWTSPWGTNAQVTLTAIQFTDVNNGWAIGKFGTVLKTTNGGSSWNYITNTGQTSSFNSRAEFFLNANTGWITTKDITSNFNFVMYTNNGGTSWTWQTPLMGTSSNNGISSVHFYDSLNGGLSCREGLIFRTTTGGIGITNISTEIPSSFSLYQNYPNPFNPTTNIRFDVQKTGFISIKIYDILGREIAILVNEQLKPGTYEVDWNASNYPSGVYFYKLSTKNYSESRRMVLIK